MGLAMEVISGFAVNPDVNITACTPSTGDQFAVRNFAQGASAWLCQEWGLGAAGGVQRIRSPRMHDNVQGIRTLRQAADSSPLLTEFDRETLYAQDNLTVELSGDAADTDGLSYLNYYSDLPGTASRLYNWQEIKARVVHQMGVQVAITTGATKGEYGGAVAINALEDQFKANTDYAILGYVTDHELQTVGIKGSDFGNLRIGGPGTTKRVETRDWFIKLANSLGMPAIPVFNAANKFNTIVDVIANTTGTGVNVSFLCAQLN